MGDGTTASLSRAKIAQSFTIRCFLSGILGAVRKRLM